MILKQNILKLKHCKLRTFLLMTLFTVLFSAFLVFMVLYDNAKENFSYMSRYTINQLTLAMHITGKKEESEQIRKWLEKVGIDEHTAKSNVKQISGGEQQRIAIARTLATDSKVILADEPTGALDKENTYGVLEIFKKLHKSECTIIIATHDKEVAKYCDRICYLDNGKLFQI